MDDENRVDNESRNFKFLLVAVFFLLAGTAFAFNLSNQTTQNTAPKDSSAIFGGRLEDGYQFSGYIISDLGSESKICSAILVSPTQAITAAHCIDNTGTKYVAMGPYTADHTNYDPVATAVVHPDWLTFNKIENDIGLVTLQNPITLSQYAEITEPSIGCNFVVVGYGKQDNSDSFTPLRKSTDVCIDDINYLGNAISFTGKDGGLCFGDSGSAIFEAGTNKFITIASSIDSCYINNFAAGAKIQGKIDLAKSTISQGASTKIDCGYIDVQNNKIIDNEDLQAFIKDYLKYCADSISLSKNIQCGSKDINKDSIINLKDLAQFADLYAAGKC